MTNTPILNTLNEAGEALASLDEDYVSLSYNRSDGTFGVGVPSLPTKRWADTFGHAPTPIEAYQIACAKRQAGAAEAARKERILRRAEELERAEEAGEQREAA